MPNFDFSIFTINYLDILSAAFLLVPLSLIGAWRWSFWLVRKISAAMYRPNVGTWPKDRKKLTVSIVTPVYNEDPVVFEEAMQSWIKNGVDEIIVVIDKSNTRHIADFERRYVMNNSSKVKCRMVVTPKPGKRAALCDGMELATGDLIALVDSDTIWSDDVVEKTLPYFLDEQVGGATVAQRIQNPDNVANVMFDILLYTRYRDEVPFLLVTGKTFNTLSGRTAFYRHEAIFSEEHDNIHLLRHEFFMGTRGISGDDKRLTHLIVEQGWHTAFVVGPVVYTPGLSSIRSFFKQRLRWTRNSWRADLRAVSRRWVFSHPALAFFMIDRFMQPLFMLIGPVVMTIAIINKEWLFVGILLTWWLISRFIRIFGYLRSYPARVIYLPAYILYGYINAIIKIYALATLIENSWATRWHKNRARRKGLLRRGFTVASGYIATVVFILAISQYVFSVRDQSGAAVEVQPPIDIQAFSEQIESSPSNQALPPKPDNMVTAASVKTYVIQPGDTLISISERLGMPVKDITRVNDMESENHISAGKSIIYYSSNAGQ